MKITAWFAGFCIFNLTLKGQSYLQFGNKIISASPPPALKLIVGKISWVEQDVVGVDIYTTGYYRSEESDLNRSQERGAYAAAGGGTYAVQELEKTVAITNFPSLAAATVGQTVTVRALRIGVYKSRSPLEFYDCGRAYVPPPLTEEQRAAIQQAAAQRAQAIQKAADAAQPKVMAWLSAQATNGSVSAQYSLGEHYLTGTGCESNLTVGVYWLEKASAGGSIEASNRLARLRR